MKRRAFLKATGAATGAGLFGFAWSGEPTPIPPARELRAEKKKRLKEPSPHPRVFINNQELNGITSLSHSQENAVIDVTELNSKRRDYIHSDSGVLELDVIADKPQRAVDEITTGASRGNTVAVNVHIEDYQYRFDAFVERTKMDIKPQDLARMNVRLRVAGAVTLI